MSPIIFLFLTFLNGFVVLSGILFAWKRYRDTFHPMIYLGLMLFYFYCYLPLSLWTEDHQALLRFFSIKQLEFVQYLNFLGVLSICAGVLAGSGQLRYVRKMNKPLGFSPQASVKVQSASIFIGVIGLAAYWYCLMHVGGFKAAYGGSYGGGWADSGWVRETVFLTIPAALWLMTAKINKVLSIVDYMLIGLFASPLLIQGLLGGRRGPTAMVIIALVSGWFMFRNRRPPLLLVVAGGVALGTLLLFLVANRSNIYLGSDQALTTREMYKYTKKANEGNEFIYGGGSLIYAQEKGNFYWGRRYLVIFVVRPIPKELWPTKYEDASRFLRVPDIQLNLGLGGDEYEDILGWSGANGAAPGIIGDMWAEFSWLFTAVLFLIGRFYGRAWRHVMVRGGPWIPNYALLTALSVYLIAQTLESAAFRYLIASAGSLLIWKLGVGFGANKNSQQKIPSA